MFCVCQILEKKWECNGTVRKLIIDLKKCMIQLGGKYYKIFSLNIIFCIFTMFLLSDCYSCKEENFYEIVISSMQCRIVAMNVCPIHRMREQSHDC
jgi:hypothetical protein